MTIKPILMKNIRWFIFGFFSVSIGLYPILYGLVDMTQGFLGGKSVEILSSAVWNWAFYQHISMGAVSMLAGWIQFSKKLRDKRIAIHRLLGKVYVSAVLLSGSAGLYLSFYVS